MKSCLSSCHYVPLNTTRNIPVNPVWNNGKAISKHAGWREDSRTILWAQFIGHIIPQVWLVRTKFMCGPSGHVLQLNIPLLLASLLKFFWCTICTTVFYWKSGASLDVLNIYKHVITVITNYMTFFLLIWQLSFISNGMVCLKLSSKFNWTVTDDWLFTKPSIECCINNALYI